MSAGSRRELKTYYEFTTDHIAETKLNETKLD